MNDLVIDPRIKQLSYSSLLTLHACPRKYQLYKLNAEAHNYADDTSGSSITFAYGHAIGTGIQQILERRTEQSIFFHAFCNWEPDLFAENTKQNKSFFGALYALRQFASMRANGYLDGYELVYYNEAPACELSFSIELPDSFMYRGFVDAVLQHSVTGKVLVLECKTTGSQAVNPAQYKHSAQAIGYSIVLDAIFPGLSSYEVLYLVYQAKAESYIQLPFEKSYYQRALWIQELLLDVDVIKMYEGVGIYPMRGESCYSWMRECEYLQTCTLSTARLTKAATQEVIDKIAEDNAAFQIKVTIADLIAAQLGREELAPTEATIIGDEML